MTETEARIRDFVYWETHVLVDDVCVRSLGRGEFGRVIEEIVLTFKASRLKEAGLDATDIYQKLSPFLTNFRVQVIEDE